jgi:hypothetical protein
MTAVLASIDRQPPAAFRFGTAPAVMAFAASVRERCDRFYAPGW